MDVVKSEIYNLNSQYGVAIMQSPKRGEVY